MTTITKIAGDTKSRLGSAAESRKYASDIIWYSAAQLLVSFILGVVTLPALTKTYGPDIYGIWIQVTVTVDLVSPIVSLQLGLAAVKFLAGEEDKKRRQRAVGAMLTAVTVFAVALSVGAAFFLRPLSYFLFDSPQYVTYVGFLIVWVCFNSVFNFFLSYLRSRSRIKEISVIQIAITALKMAAIIALATRAAAIEWIFAAMVGLQVLFALVTTVMVAKEIGIPIPNFRGVRTFLAYSVPQIPVFSLLWVVALSDRYFITHFLGLSETGIFSSSSMLASFLSLLYFPISYVLFPQVIKLREQKRFADIKGYIESSTRFFLTLAIPMGAGITIVSQPLLRILSTSEFLAGKEIVLLLAIGTVFLGVYQINTSLILADNKAKWLAVITGAGCVTSVMLNFLLIPRLGIMGAAVANCISYLVLAIITTVWTRRTIRYSFHLPYLGKVVLSAAAMVLSLIFLRLDSGLGLLVAIVLGSAVFGAGLVVSRAFTSDERRLIGKALTSLLARKEA